jgi:stress responsive alpha/beta barrel protein
MFRSLTQTVCFAAGFAAVGGIFAAAMMSHQSAATAQDAAAAAPLRHVVLFKFKAEATKEQVQEIVAGFQALPKKIDGITAFEYGTDVSPEGLADGFTHCFLVSFKDAKSRDAYLPHAAHKEFVALALPRVEKVLVVDYFARK